MVGQHAGLALGRAQLTSLYWLLEASSTFSQSERSIFDLISPKAWKSAKLLPY